MKRSILAVLLIISLALLPLAPPQATAASGYTEKLSVYVAGSNAAWFTTVGPVNVTNPLIISAESISGVSSYNLTAMRAASWTADFISFGPQGYNVLPIPFVPPQGAFLTVASSSFADASNAASKFSSYLLTTFKSTSNASGSYSFFAPIAFASVVPSTLLDLLPFSAGGLLAPLTAVRVVGLPSPMVTLSAQRAAGSGFVHQIRVGSITSSGLDSTGRPNIFNYFGAAAAFLSASNKTSSSTIELHFLDGLVVSSDSAKLSSDTRAYSSSYVLTLKPGGRVSKINATVIEQPPELLATRLVDVGVLRPGSNMSVTISLSNLSNSTTLQNISVNDSWWKTTPGFKLVRGSSNVTVSSLSAGGSTSPTYVLQYTGNSTQPVQVPTAPVSFNYVAGSALETGHSSLNPIAISLGVDQPVVFAYLTPSGSLGGPVGSNQSLRVVVKNVGTRAASSVTVNGRPVGGLSADGGTATVNVFAAAPSFATVNVSKSYSVSYSTASGQSSSLTTNTLQVIFSHTGMKLGFGLLSMNASLTHLSGGSGYNVVLTLDLANKGSANMTGFVAKTALPAGLPCGKASSNLTCVGNSLTLSYALLKPGAKGHDSVSFNVTRPASLLFWPAAFSYLSSGFTVTGQSNAQPAPTGLVVSKQFSPSEMFPGMASRVTALASNNGPYNMFNVTLSSTADVFDSLQANQTTTKTSPTLAPAANVTLSYGVTAGTSSNSQPATPATARFFMGGTPFTISTSSIAVRVDPTISATVVPSPSTPTEGNPFAITVTVRNTAGVAVSSVNFVLPIPSGITVSNPTNATFQNGKLTVSVGSLGGGSSYTAKATVSANSGQTIPFDKKAKLTFNYSGQTLTGNVPSGGIAISENVTTRYILPAGIAILAVLVVAYEVRRMAGPSALSSQK